MDRRAFVIMALAGAADSGSGVRPPQAVRVADATPEPAALSGDTRFSFWLKGFVGQAILAGLPAEVVTRELTGLTPDPRVNTLDTRQPEFAKPISDYIKGVVTSDKIARGRKAMAGVGALGHIQDDYGVPAPVLTAIWGVETDYGAITGDYDVIRSLATLAAAGRRRDWAEGQLIAALRIIAEGDASRGQLRGSWAGAMGQTQFEPDTYLSTAVSARGNGRADIWGSAADALASAANLLAKAGWVRGQAWQREVNLPAGFDYSVSEGPRQSPADWSDLGVRTADGRGWNSADRQGRAQLILPSGAGGPAFLAFDNHFVIRKYNASTAYALAVGLLADRIGGADPLITPWPHEDALSLSERTAAQNALARIGFSPGSIDGVVGADTRAALRRWQKARGLPADGYLSREMIQRLTSEAASAGPLTAAPAPAQPAPAPMAAPRQLSGGITSQVLPPVPASPATRN